MHATETPRADTLVDVPVDLRSLWKELIHDPESPERFELNEHGEVVVSPSPSNVHQIVVACVIEQLLAHLGGYVSGEVSIQTPSAGIRKPDAAWLPRSEFGVEVLLDPLETPPPLVVEVLSPGNRKPALARKVRGYLQAGVKEVLVVGLDGSVSVHRADGIHADSAFGVKLELSAELFRSGS